MLKKLIRESQTSDDAEQICSLGSCILRQSDTYDKDVVGIITIRCGLWCALTTPMR